MNRKNHTLIMKKKSNFILSFDCEGKWGNPQKANSAYAKFTNDTLIEAYQKIISLLEKYDTPATFAFVSTLIINPSRTLEILEKETCESNKNMKFGSISWVSTALKDLSDNKYHGWYCPELIEIVRNLKDIHICSHGGCHIPYSESLTSSNSIEKDILLIESAFKKFPNIDRKTFIYPRNIIGFQDKLKSIGIRGYRNIDIEEKKIGIKGKLIRYMNEFHSLDRFSQEYDKKEKSRLIALSSSKFINAHIEERRLIPRSVTKHRVRKMIKRSFYDSNVVHFYSHPHNFISDPGLYKTLEEILQIASKYRESNQLDIITMKEEVDKYEN